MTLQATSPHAAAAAVLRDLCHGQTASLDLLVQQVYSRHGRRLKVHAWHIDDGDLPVTRISVSNTDHVFYPSDTSEPHRQHILLREIAARALTDRVPLQNSAVPHPVHALFPAISREAVAESLPDLPAPPDAATVEHLATFLGLCLMPPPATSGRTLAALEPLRRMLMRGGAPPVEATTAPSYLYRQVIDINDALWRLRRHLSPHVRAQAEQSVQRAGMRGLAASAASAAIQWRAALIAEQREPPGKDPLPLPPAGRDFTSEVRRLVALAHAFHDPRLGALERSPHPVSDVPPPASAERALICAPLRR
ncbi:DUF6545 domain-containing protein [Streptomyces sp. NPDC001073]